METKKIGEIREEFKAAEETMLPSFIEKYRSDERAGVQKLIEQANGRLAKLEAERARIDRLWKYEREYGMYTRICGIDEVGRGPLAGPVVAGAVILPKDCDILYINDSKKLSAAKREELYDVIMEKAVAVGIGMVGPERIDEINILQATYEAMREAISKLGDAPDILLNDAVTIPEVTIPQVRGCDTAGADYQGRCQEHLDRRGQHCGKSDQGPADGGVRQDHARVRIRSE